ncbi:MAG: UDP-4-amino-4,6-dideoxy-N-acetyl-beta-L-altrosamine transaminase [Desulfuromonadaceae bacterium]|nr:UDP-4-amino-4,6-dideoxy-N-acetyl-beta-L-altrosamine transaminase [Desulfuromonadaceae bacterium]MDD2855496.1 UDP-4-amino-4,6-dideoxy-N-acetyl-beta-L-altrosamine transaminase [Desulfuromonadaceae bacterium]
MNNQFIPYGRQSISEADIQAVVDVLRSDWLTQGPAVEHFEKLVAQYCGAKYAVAVNSATSALHIASLAAGLGTGDTLWTAPNTFVASANCGLYCGADVDFVDIDPRTYNISIVGLEEKLVLARQSNKLPKVVIPVHFSGQSCDMSSLYKLSQDYGFSVIEDASHAIGGKYLGTPIGGCRFSDMTVFSFHPVKIITTGEGGMVITNRQDLYERLIRLRSHGITREPSLMVGESHGPWYYQQVELGFNYRITDLQAALGASQMSRLNEFVARRHELALRYNRLLGDLPLTLPWQDSDGYSAFHLYVIRVDIPRRKKVFEALRAANIGVNIHYIPVHTQPYYQQKGFTEGMFPEAERYYAEAISLPIFSAMTESQQDRVVSLLREALS